jgi:hypothetical protein
LRFLGVEVAWLGSLPEADAVRDERDDAMAAAETPEVEAMSLRVLGRFHGI